MGPVSGMNGVLNGVSSYEKPREGTFTLLRQHSEGE